MNRITWASMIAIVLIASAVIADSSNQRPLHEDLSPPADQMDRSRARLNAALAVLGPSPAELQNPSAIASGDRLLPEPGAVDPKKDDPVFGSGDFGTKRNETSRPDRSTGADSTLHYIEVFNPSIVPFKRMTAYDRIESDYTLSFDSRSLTDLDVGRTAGDQRDMFWGDVSVKLKPGEDVAIPSVAPDMQILSYEVTPVTNLSFSKDSADNYYVRTEENRSGLHRIVFLVDANPVYFAPKKPPRDLRVRELPPELLPVLPDTIQKSATRALRKLKLNGDTRVGDALDILAYYFRAFEAQEPPPATDDIYWDLFESQAGVCRHRSFAFTITANALGIPTRFVANEAHAWVESWLPPHGWQRIDLGGAAETLDVANAGDKAMYQPRNKDPFAKPPQYSNGYTQLTGDVRGLRSTQIQERRNFGPPNSTSVAEAVNQVQSDDPAMERTLAPGTQPTSGLAELQTDEHLSKKQTVTTVKNVSRRAYRGEQIAISGSVTDAAGRGVEGQSVELFLVLSDNRDRVFILGNAVTGDGGNYTASLSLPTTLDLARYEVFAASAGDDDYRPSLSK